MSFLVLPVVALNNNFTGKWASFLPGLFLCCCDVFAKKQAGDIVAKVSRD
jgi:hypothetical protein